MMIEAYLDESGIHDGASVCVVAGYYGTQAAWRKFEKEWNKLIADYPELTDRGFHAKDFFRRENGKRVGVYETWDDEKARKFLDRLVQCVMRNRVFPITFAIIVGDFKRLSLINRKWLTGAKFTIAGKPVTSGCPNKSYYVPFNFCILDSARTSGANATDKIHFFVGLDSSFSGYANALYSFVLNDARLPASVRGLLGQISYPLASKTPGLQAADLLAYRLYRFALDKVAAKDNLPIPLLVSRLTRNRKPNQRFDLLDSSRLNRIIQMGQQTYDQLMKEGRISEYLNRLRGS